MRPASGRPFGFGNRHRYLGVDCGTAWMCVGPVVTSLWEVADASVQQSHGSRHSLYTNSTLLYSQNTLHANSSRSRLRLPCGPCRSWTCRWARASAPWSFRTIQKPHTFSCWHFAPAKCTHSLTPLSHTLTHTLVPQGRWCCRVANRAKSNASAMPQCLKSHRYGYDPFARGQNPGASQKCCRSTTAATGRRRLCHSGC